VVSDSDSKHRIAELVADGDRRQMADRRFRRELAAWLRPNTSSAPDGLRGHGFGFPDIMSHLGPLVMRTFDLGNSQAAKDEEIAAGAPALVVVCTDRDDPEAWLATGQALARLLLRVHASELWASYLNQPIEVEELRSELADLLGDCPQPQLLLRLGHAGRRRSHSPGARRPMSWRDETALDGRARRSVGLDRRRRARPRRWLRGRRVP